MWIQKDKILQHKILLELGIKHFIIVKKYVDNIVFRKEIFNSFNLDYDKLITAGQVHQDKIYKINFSDIGQKISGVDGLISDLKNIPIGIFTADCVPLFIVNKKINLYGLIHIGWRGLSKNIIFSAMKFFNNDKNNIIVVLGPHICYKCYTVDKNVGNLFPKSFVHNKLNLSNEIKLQLNEFGITDNKIFSSQYCTYHTYDLFYSYRKGDKDKRIISVISA